MEMTGDADLHAYMKDIKKYPLLSAKREKELGKRKDKGDEKARKELITSNLRLVISIAKNYTGKGLSLQDLVQEGNIGLIKTIKSFDITRGCRFSTFAVPWIKQHICRALINKSQNIRIPVHQVEILHSIRRARAVLGKESNNVTLENIAEFTEIPIEKIEHAIKAYKTSQTVSMSNCLLSTDGDENPLLLEDALSSNDCEKYDNKKL